MAEDTTELRLKYLEGTIPVLEHQGRQLVNILGLHGTNGRLGAIEKDCAGLEGRMSKIEKLHYRVLAACLAGSAIGTVLFNKLLGG
jgi:hypothetical protein